MEPTTTFDLQGLTVIEPNNGNDENIFLIAEESWFTKMRLSETYGGFGQKVSNYEAGDYCLSNYSSDAVKDCKNSISEKFGIEYNNIHLVDDGDVFEIEAGDGEEYGFNEDDVNSFISEWQKENESFTEVLGYTFWDGHNFQTVTIETDEYEPTFKRVDDETENAILKEYFAYDDYKPYGAGCQKAVGEQFVFFKSQWQGEWQVAKVEYNTNEYE